jgi:hypothetical protein
MPGKNRTTSVLVPPPYYREYSPSEIQIVPDRKTMIIEKDHSVVIHDKNFPGTLLKGHHDPATHL